MSDWKMGKQSGRKGPQPVTFTDEEMKYTWEEFMAPGQDDKGISVRITVRVPPVMERAIEVVLASRRFPYRTNSDLVRHAIFRQLAWLHTLEPTMPKTFLGGLAAINEVVRDAELNLSFQETFRKLFEMAELQLAAGDEPEAVRLLSLARSKMIQVPDTRWRKTFLNRFTEKFAKYFSPRPELPEGTGGNIVEITRIG